MRALIFDLDGTLIDTVYAHVLAWQRALAEAGMPIDGWRVHRKIGMSGGLLTRAVAREIGHALESDQTLVIGTGGFSRLFEREKMFDVLQPDLILVGLERALSLNPGASGPWSASPS